MNYKTYSITRGFTKRYVHHAGHVEKRQRSLVRLGFTESQTPRLFLRDERGASVDGKLQYAEKIGGQRCVGLFENRTRNRKRLQRKL